MYDLILLANLALWLGFCAFFLTRPNASVFHPAACYLFFHALVFTLRPFLVYYRGYDLIYRAYQFIPTIEDKITAMLGAMLGLVCFMVPALHKGTALPAYRQDRFDLAERRRLAQPFLLTALLLVPIGLASALANWDVRAAEATTMVRDAATGRLIHTSGNGYFSDAQILLGPLAVICAWLFRFRWWSFAPLAGFIVLRAGTGGRWPIMIASASAILLLLYEHKRHWPRWRDLALAIAALALFQQLGVDRGAAIRSLFIADHSTRAENSAKGAEPRFLEGMDFGNLEYFEFLVYAIPQRTGTYDYFLDNLQLLTQPIPRALWPGKPVGPPIQRFALFDYGYPIGMTFSLPGEGWAQLGYLGVALWCGLFGWLAGWAYNRFQHSRHDNRQVVTFALLLPLSLSFFRDGWLLTLVQAGAYMILPAWLLFLMARLAGIPMAPRQRLLAYRRLVSAR